MNTPVHITLAIALLGKKGKPKQNKWIALGALIPDLAMFGLFAYEVTIGTPQRIIWSEKYYGPLWQNTTDLFNSIPLLVALYWIALAKKWSAVQMIALAALIHVAADLPLHHDDGHRHFFPISDWRFESPVSYWDPAHYGQYWSVVEIGILITTVIFAYRLVESQIAKGLLLASLAVSILFPLAFYLL